MYRIIRSYIGDSADIDDIIQNTHIKAFEKLFQFKLSSSYSKWLIRIGINEALGSLREKKKIININSNIDQKNSILEKPDSLQSNPENSIIHNEVKVLLEKAIDDLDSKFKSVYFLKEIEDMSLKDVADCLNISYSNAKVRLFRAKQILKDKLYDTVSVNGVFEFGFKRCDCITDKVMKEIFN